MPVNKNNNRLVIPNKTGDQSANWEVIERWANSQVVNGLIAGTNVTLSAQEQTLTPYGNPPDTGIVTINATGGGGTGVTTVTSNDGSVIVTNPTGPSTDLSVHRFVFTTADSSSGSGPSNVAGEIGATLVCGPGPVVPSEVQITTITTHVLTIPAGNSIVVGWVIRPPTWSAGSAHADFALDISNTSGTQQLGLEPNTVFLASGANQFVTWANVGYSTGSDIVNHGTFLTSTAGGQFVYRVTLLLTVSGLAP